MSNNNLSSSGRQQNSFMQIAKYLWLMLVSLCRTIAAHLDRMNMAAAQQKQEQERALAEQQKLLFSFDFQHDLAAFMNGMNPPAGLTNILCPENLTYEPSLSNKWNVFAYRWDKTSRNFPLSPEILQRTSHSIVTRAKQLSTRLLKVMPLEDIYTQYPLFYYGFSNLWLENRKDSVIIYITVNI